MYCIPLQYVYLFTFDTPKKVGESSRNDTSIYIPFCSSSDGARISFWNLSVKRGETFWKSGSVMILSTDIDLYLPICKHGTIVTLKTAAKNNQLTIYYITGYLIYCLASFPGLKLEMSMYKCTYICHLKEKNCMCICMHACSVSYECLLLVHYSVSHTLKYFILFGALIKQLIANHVELKAQ